MKWKSSSRKRARAAEVGSSLGAKGSASKLTARSHDGKVRLVLYEDSGGGSAWRLAAPLFEQTWQNVLTESVVNITAKRFQNNRDDYASALEMAGEALTAFSAMCQGWLERGGNGNVACHSGCSHCCHQTVGITPLEGFAIADLVLQTRSADELQSLLSKLDQRVAETVGLTAKEQYSPRFPCVFLADGACSIYAARPLVCRGMNSLDADACHKRMFDEETRARFLTEGKDGLCYMEPILGAKAVSAGLQFALSDLFDLEMRPQDLHLVVRGILADALSANPTRSRNWIAGEQGAFKSA
jgi:Fe-S-cluster containining protein